MFFKRTKEYFVGTSIYLNILESEGISSLTYNPGLRMTNELINASEYLFGFMLSDSDPRWLIVSAYTKLSHFQPYHFENALTATYLSNKPSYRNEYSKWVSEANIRHLCRAIVNVGENQRLQSLFSNFLQTQNYKIIGVRTGTTSIKKGKNQFGITGCPEALYQLQLFNFGQYIGRVGFNLHKEYFDPVLSITNLQGVPQGLELYNQFEVNSGIGPFNLLVQKVVDLGNLFGATVYGIKNPKINASLYNTVFKREGIQRVSFKK